MSARDEFADEVRRPQVGLAVGCSLIAEHLGHPMGVHDSTAQLDELAASIRDALEHARMPVDLDGVAHQLFGPFGYTGNRTNYHDPSNSLLPEVLRRRTGIPITLAVVVIEVAERCGLHATGVGMPGHFLVGDGPAPTRWLDGFEGGIWLDAPLAIARFRSLHGASAAFDPSFLAPTPPATILARVLANLATCYRGVGDPTALVRVLELRSSIPGVGSAPRARAELAEALVSVGRIDDALEELDLLLGRVDVRRRGVVEARIATLRASRN